MMIVHVCFLEEYFESCDYRSCSISREMIVVLVVFNGLIRHCPHCWRWWMWSLTWWILFLRGWLRLSPLIVIMSVLVFLKTFSFKHLSSSLQYVLFKESWRRESISDRGSQKRTQRRSVADSLLRFVVWWSESKRSSIRVAKYGRDARWAWPSANERSEWQRTRLQ